MLRRHDEPTNKLTMVKFYIALVHSYTDTSQSKLDMCQSQVDMSQSQLNMSQSQVHMSQSQLNMSQFASCVVRMNSQIVVLRESNAQVYQHLPSLE